MRGGMLAFCIVTCACNVRLGGGGSPDARDRDAPIVVDDAPIDGEDGLGPWGTPLKIPGASTTTDDEDDGTFSSNTLEAFYSLADPADAGRKHIYTVTRANAGTMVWSAPERLSFNLNGTTDQTPRLTDDGLSMYFASNRPGTTGGLDIWYVSRVGGVWGTPTLVPGVNSPQTEKTLTPCQGGRYVVISGRGGVSEDPYEGVLGGAAPTRINELYTDKSETGTFISADCLTMYFASNRTNDTNMIYRATRSAIGPWGPPTTVVDFAITGGAQEDPWLSADLRTFMFSTEIGGNKDVYIATR